MKLIIGLGNPGIQYEKTRHNFGWRAVDKLAREMEASDWKIDLRFNAFVAECFLDSEKIIFAKPQTFMNNSGIAVKSIADYYKVPTEEILIIHDEIDLPLGEAKIQKARGAAGHNGVKSIIEKLKSKDFIRMRLGIKPKENSETENSETEFPSHLGNSVSEFSVSKFVLQNFTKEEEKIVQKTIKKAIQIIRTAF